MTARARVIARRFAFVARFGFFVGQSRSPNTFLLFLRLKYYWLELYFLFFDEF
jgi:hypothetical protein